MLDSISPYALLRASKPQAPEVFTTAYDRFSAAQHQTSSQYPVEAMHHTVPFSEPQPDTNSAPIRRTHYIADIHAKHTCAVKRTTKPITTP